MQNATAIIAAGGAGLRMGGTNPKQFAELAGLPIIIRTIRAFCQAPSISAIIVVAPAAHLEHTEKLLAEHHLADRCLLTPGGRLRQDSVRLGLGLVADDCPLVAVHDAARPIIAPEDIEHCLAAAEKMAKQKGTLPQILILFLGEPEQVAPFFNETSLNEPYMILPPEQFFPLLKTSPPRVLLLKRGNVIKEWNGEF